MPSDFILLNSVVIPITPPAQYAALTNEKLLDFASVVSVSMPKLRICVANLPRVDFVFVICEASCFSSLVKLLVSILALSKPVFTLFNAVVLVSNAAADFLAAASVRSS